MASVCVVLFLLKRCNKRYFVHCHVLTEKEQPVDWIKSDLNLQDYSMGIRLRLEHPKVIFMHTLV